MQHITAVTGVTVLNDTQIETSFSKLKIKIAGVATKAQLDAAEIQLAIVSKQGGQRTQTFWIPVSTLMEFSSKEGLFIIKANQLEGTIDTTRFGSLLLGDGEYISVSFRNLIPGMILNMWSIDTPISNTRVIKYDPAQINGAAPKDLNVTSAYTIAVPVARITKLQMTYNLNGGGVKACEWGLEELKGIAIDANEIVCIEDDVAVYGYRNYIMLGIEDASKAQYTPLDATVHNVYLFKEVNKSDL